MVTCATPHRLNRIRYGPLGVLNLDALNAEVRRLMGDKAGADPRMLIVDGCLKTPDWPVQSHVHRSAV
jgi:hypothetical protein